jgi:hypothetical protein
MAAINSSAVAGWQAGFDDLYLLGFFSMPMKRYFRSHRLVPLTNPLNIKKTADQG